LLLDGAWAPFDGWQLVCVEGRHRERFLHSQLTSDVRGLDVGSSQTTALLDRSARLQGFGFLLKRAERIELLMPSTAARAVCERLDASVIADEVTVRRVEVPRLVLVLGPEALRLHSRLPDDQVFPLAGWGSRGFVTWWSGDIGLPQLDQTELEARRVLWGLPRWGGEAAAGQPVHETSLVELAVSFTKGCYLGQETVAKVASGRGAAKAPMVLELEDRMDDADRIVGRTLTVGGEAAGEVLAGALWEGRTYLQLALRRRFRVRGLEMEGRLEDGMPVTGRVRPLPVLETPPPGEWARRLQMAAVAAFSEDREGEAIELLERALAVWPGHADSYESLGVILGRHERYEEAVALMQRLLEVDPESVMAHTNLSLYYNRLGRIEDAEREAGLAARAAMRREQSEREREEATRRADAEAAADRARRAEMFRQVLEIDPGDALGNFGLGELLLEEERWADAREHLQRALEADPRYSAALLALGRAHEGAGDAQSAVETYRRGIEVATGRGDLAIANSMQERLAILTAPADG
jgi:folate-binding protein YgfZ